MKITIEDKNERNSDYRIPEFFTGYRTEWKRDLILDIEKNQVAEEQHL